MKKRTLIALAAGLLLLSGCGHLIWVCVEKPKDIENAYKYTDQKPLTAEGMKRLLTDDTLHYKVVVIYSLCCGPCSEQMKYTYSKLWNLDTARVRWHFVLSDCSSLKYGVADYLARYGITTPYMYYLRDDDPRFSTNADDRYCHLAQYIFDRQPEVEDVVGGIPCVFVVSPEGRLLTECRRYADGTVVVGNYDGLYRLVYRQVAPELVPREAPLSVASLDFYSRDTVDYSGFGDYGRARKVCTPEGCR